MVFTAQRSREAYRDKPINSLSTEQKCELVASLQTYLLDATNRHLGRNEPVPERHFGPELDALTALLNSLTFSEAYNETQNRIAGELSACFRSAAFSDIAENWPYMNNRERAGELNYFTDTMTGIQSRISGLPIVPAILRIQDSPFQKAGGGKLTGVFGEAVYSPHEHPENYRITINSNPVAAMKSIDTAFNTAAHEQTHIFQANLAYLAAKDMIHPRHPLYEDAHMLKALFLRKASSFTRLGPGYKAHPIERDAFAMGDFVEDDLRPLSRPPVSRSSGQGVSAALFLAGAGLLGYALTQGLNR